MKKFIVILIVLCAGIVLIESCKKDDRDPLSTCNDGIQNQGETGIDCGGPCNSCSMPICNGNGTTDYMPLALNNSWFYRDPGTSQFTLTITEMTTFNGQAYHRVQNSLGGSLYLRENANGDIMAWSTSDNMEFLYVPGAPINNQVWPYPLQFAATRRVISTNASLTTTSCTYTGLLQIQHFDATGQPQATLYYKRGVGLVSTDEIFPGQIQTNLESITLH